MMSAFKFYQKDRLFKIPFISMKLTEVLAVFKEFFSRSKKSTCNLKL